MTKPRPTLTELVTQLEGAVRTGDRVRALELARQIQQRLVRETDEQAGLERRVRALLAELDAAKPRSLRLDLKALSGERSASPAESEGVVYPVWFGTNRQPAADGSTFTNTRHSATTRGRVLVQVPEAHRFGETGNAFWKRLLRFDLRDDRLRLQRVERRERNAFLPKSTQPCRPRARPAARRTRCSSCTGSTSASRTPPSAPRKSAAI